MSGKGPEINSEDQLFSSCRAPTNLPLYDAGKSGSTTASSSGSNTILQPIDQVVRKSTKGKITDETQFLFDEDMDDEEDKPKQSEVPSLRLNINTPFATNGTK